LTIAAGLGQATGIEEIEIRWPNAKQSTEIISNIKLDTLIRVREGFGKQ